MKGFIAVKEGKVWDKCGQLINKRTDDPLPVKDYIEVDLSDVVFGDTWVSETKTNLEDSPSRTAEQEKTEEQLKLEVLESRILELEVTVFKP